MPGRKLLWWIWISRHGVPLYQEGSEAPRGENGRGTKKTYARFLCRVHMGAASRTYTQERTDALLTWMHGENTQSGATWQPVAQRTLYCFRFAKRRTVAFLICSPIYNNRCPGKGNGCCSYGIAAGGSARGKPLPTAPTRATAGGCQVWAPAACRASITRAASSARGRLPSRAEMAAAIPAAWPMATQSPVTR